MPEVTLPVVPGMEGCHWPFRKANHEDWPRLLQLLLSGEPVRAGDAIGWLVDFAGPLEETLRIVWKVVTEGDHSLSRRGIEDEALEGVPTEARLRAPDSPAIEAARKAIMETVQDACGSTLSEALSVQARHCAEFMTTEPCRRGRIGAEYERIIAV